MAAFLQASKYSINFAGLRQTMRRGSHGSCKVRFRAIKVRPHCRPTLLRADKVTEERKKEAVFAASLLPFFCKRPNPGDCRGLCPIRRTGQATLQEPWRGSVAHAGPMRGRPAPLRVVGAARSRSRCRRRRGRWRRPSERRSPGPSIDRRGSLRAICPPRSVPQRSRDRMTRSSPPAASRSPRWRTRATSRSSRR